MSAVIPETDSRLRHQILDRARDKDFAGTRFSSDARADVKRETEHLRSAHLVFAHVQHGSTKVCLTVWVSMPAKPATAKRDRVVTLRRA